MSDWLRVGLTMNLDGDTTPAAKVQIVHDNHLMSITPAQAREVATLLLLNADLVERLAEDRLVVLEKPT